MENKTRDIKKNCGPSLARPYINNQIFTEMYCLSDALKFGTIFPELNLLESEMTTKNYMLSKKNIEEVEDNERLI